MIQYLSATKLSLLIKEANAQQIKKEQIIAIEEFSTGYVLLYWERDSNDK